VRARDPRLDEPSSLGGKARSRIAAYCVLSCALISIAIPALTTSNPLPPPKFQRF
jgi:hypothetical protein